MRTLVYILFLSSIGPLIRFYRHNFFYYFFFAAIIDPIVYFVTSILGYTHLGNSIYLFSNLLLVYVLPDLKFKYKFIFTLFLLFYSIIDRSEVTTLILILFIMIFILIYLTNIAVRSLINKREIILFVIPLFIVYLTALILTYLYYANPLIVTETIKGKLILYSIINVIITLAGPDYEISIEKYFPYKIILHDRKFSETDLIKFGLSAREIEAYNYLLQGYSNSEIADRMFIDKRTVESHLGHIRDKMGFKSMSEFRRYIFTVLNKNKTT